MHLPHLQTLRLCFRKVAAKFTDPVLKALIAPLSARLKSGYKLDTLHNDGCYLCSVGSHHKQDVVEGLSALVGNAILKSDVDTGFY